MQYARESTLTISRSDQMDRLEVGSWLRRWSTLFYERWSRNSIARQSSSFIRFYLRDERTSPVRKFKMPIAKMNARRSAHDECQDRHEIRYREPEITRRPSAIESLTYLHNVLIINRMYKVSQNTAWECISKLWYRLIYYFREIRHMSSLVYVVRFFLTK